MCNLQSLYTVYTVYHLSIFVQNAYCRAYPVQLGYSQASYLSTSGFNSQVWCYATLNAEYRHFVKAPGEKKG